MALDTKYRPHRFDEVLGQIGTITVLRQFIQSGIGFHQSYLFAGPFGSGKTTLGRILARALLCEHPVEGDPCDECPSCLSILENGTNESFVEVDAATNSGKKDIKQITQEIQYSTFSGKRRLYLFDEAHQLSRDALDAMLKPMEEVANKEGGRKLVCIFCTTEPEKMRSTILSRCAPAFYVETLPPDVIADRLAFICDQEAIDYDSSILPLIAEHTECHIRDALKAVEGVSMLGSISRENVYQYLHLDLNRMYLEVLRNLQDVGKLTNLLGDLSRKASPAVCYEKLSRYALLAFKASQSSAANTPSYLERQILVDIGTHYGSNILEVASFLGQRSSGAITFHALECDLLYLSQWLGGKYWPPIGKRREDVLWNAVPVNNSSIETEETGTKLAGDVPKVLDEGSDSRGILSIDKKSLSTGKVSPEATTRRGVHIDPRAQRRDTVSTETSGNTFEIPLDDFSRLLVLSIQELSENKRGSTGQTDMGDN